MFYLVLVHLEKGYFSTDKEPLTARNTYGETYEEAKKPEALAYFWKSLIFAIEHRKELNEAGAGDYKIIFCELEAEKDEKPRREIYRLTITPAGAVGLWAETKADEREIIRGLKQRLGKRYLITEEPLTESQTADTSRLLKPIAKA